MDVAKRLADWRDQPPEQWFTALNRYVLPVVTALLVIAIAYQLATLTWALVPGSVPAVAPVPRPAASGGEAATADFGALAGSHLFGEAAEQPATPVATPVIDAPDTTLNLLLRGILSKEGDANGSAIISANRSDEKTYYVGQTIVGADGATLHSVYSDRVLINRNGRLETLRLPKELSSSAGPMAMPSPLPQAPAPNAVSLRGAIDDNASRISDVLRVQPHVQEGQFIGFRLTPGRDSAAFEALGLRAGDVVTDINGTVLDDPARSVQVYQSLGEATQANVTVLRDGVPQVIVIDTSLVQRLRENRR